MINNDDPKDALAYELGKYILDQLPYGAAVTFPPLPPPAPSAAVTKTTSGVREIPATYGTTVEVDVEGLYKDNTAAKPFKMENFVPNDALVGLVKAFRPAQLNRLMHWTIDGASHQVTKSIRIWYTYERKDAAGTPEDPKTVGAWLVIGYVGNGH